MVSPSHGEYFAEKNKKMQILLLDDLLEQITKQLSINKKIGFIYFDVIKSADIKSRYGEPVYSELLNKVAGNLLDLYDSILMNEDIIAIDSFSKDCFLIFLSPSTRYFFAMEDLRLTLQRIFHRLNERVNLAASGLGITQKIEFYSGCNFIFPDPLLSTRRLIYEAHKESVLNCRVYEFIVRFINNVSHELRTPITSIKGYVETLLDGAMTDPDTCRHFLDVINLETNRLVKLSTDLLDLSLLQTGFVEIKFQVLHAESLILKALDLVKPYADSKSIALIYDVTTFNHKVWCDGDKIVQALGYILDNAIRYSPEGSKVEIAVKKQDEYLRVEVVDHGYGIPPKSMSRIFEIFERVDDDRSLEKGGRGLGLALARSIVEAHGGIIGAESEVGKGSTFYFLIIKKE